jgi:hypothetical protein
MMSSRFFELPVPGVVYLRAQSEGALRQAFEGKTVRVKMDLPATSEGVDIQYRAEPPLNFRSYSQRIRRFTVRVKGKKIGFHLAGGDYGALGDPSGNVSLGTVSKSRREQGRKRENGDRRARAVELTALRQREIEEKRLQAGSRLNLRFPDNYRKESVPTPQEIRTMLVEYVAFDGLAGSGEVAMPRSARVRKGMTMQVTATWARSGGARKVDYTNGVAVKFSVQGE